MMWRSTGQSFLVFIVIFYLHTFMNLWNSLIEKNWQNTKLRSSQRRSWRRLQLHLTSLWLFPLFLLDNKVFLHMFFRDSKLTRLLSESLGNINCQTTMIAHISDSVASYMETLTTVQLASQIRRVSKKSKVDLMTQQFYYCWIKKWSEVVCLVN